MKGAFSDPYGVVLLCDQEQAGLLDPESNPKWQKALSAAANDGKVFFIDREDPIKDLRVQVVTATPAEPNFALRFSRVGGSFLLHAPSGKLALSGVGEWAHDPGAAASMEVEPGSYSVIVHSSEDLDSQLYEQDMRRVVGAEEWRHRKKLDRLYLVGCLPTLLAIGVSIFSTWKLGLYLLAVAAILWLPYVLGIRSRRYRAAEEARATYESELPLFVLQLNKLENTEGLVGGYVR